MIVDKKEFFLTSGGSETLGGKASGVSDYIDFSAKGALDSHKKIFFCIQRIADFTFVEEGHGDADAVVFPELTLSLVGCDDHESWDVVEWEESYDYGDDEAMPAYIMISVPLEVSQYLRIEWEIEQDDIEAADEDILTGVEFSAFLYTE